MILTIGAGEWDFSLSPPEGLWQDHEASEGRVRNSNSWQETAATYPAASFRRATASLATVAGGRCFFDGTGKWRRADQVSFT